MRRERGKTEPMEGAWPEYLEPLRPDEVTRHRLRKNVLLAAERLLERPRSWFDVTAGWSSVLAPLAAAVILVAAVIAYQTSVPSIAEAEAPVEPSELAQSLAPDAEAPPELLIEIDEPSRDAILAAALVTP